MQSRAPDASERLGDWHGSRKSGVAVGPELDRFRGWAFVASYSSATVAEFHGVPCADVILQERLKELGRRVGTREKDFKEIRRNPQLSLLC
jgi:hypothetical protein